MPARKPKDITKLMLDGREIDRAIKRAVREALLQHKLAGKPVCEWRDGRVVWIPASKIKVGRPRKRKRRA